MLQKKINFVWHGAEMPGWATRNVDEFRTLNPDHEITVHGEEVLLDRYRRLYDATNPPPGGFAQRADLLRLSALQKFGGWYFDIDFFPIRPVSDLVRAYQLDGRRLVVSEQHGQKNKKLRVGNGILAGNPDAPAFAILNEQLDTMPDKPSGVALGPGLFTRLVGQRSDLFKLIRWPWFFPCAIGEAVDRYNRLIAGDDPMDVFWDKFHDTVGQLPYGLHLWAGGKRDLVGNGEAARGTIPTLSTYIEGADVGIVANDRQWGDGTQPFFAISEGFRRLGCRVQIAKPGPWPIFNPGFDPSVVIMWNGRKNQYIGISAAARAAGKTVLVMEHGFFDRRAYSQIDHQGILHWSSWADSTRQPAAPQGAARLAAVWKPELRPFEARDGYVLVLGQVDGDSQLHESEIRKRSELVRLVAAAMPSGVEARFRPHPNRAKHTASTKRYMPVCHAETLEEAINGAKFAITINSNAGNECLAMGCPVLAFGPALYLKAGVARQATRAGLETQIRQMCNGIRPSLSDVRNYLEHLCLHQFNLDEFATGIPILNAIAGAAKHG